MSVADDINRVNVERGWQEDEEERRAAVAKDVTPRGLHHVRVSVPGGRSVLTRIEVDGQELRGVSLLEFRHGMDGMAVLRLDLYADVEIEGEAQLVKEWRRWRPSRLSRLLSLRPLR